MRIQDKGPRMALDIPKYYDLKTSILETRSFITSGGTKSMATGVCFGLKYRRT